MLRVRIALIVGLAVTVAAIATVLAGAPSAVLATNSVPESGPLNVTSARSARICQGGERLPAGTRAIQVSIEDFTGPHVNVEVYSGARIVTSGVLGAGWSGRAVPIPVPRVHRAISPVEVCLESSSIGEPITMVGSSSSKSEEAHSASGMPVGGRLRIDYLGPGRTSWLARAGSVMGHMGLGRAWNGAWIAPFVLMLALATATAACAVMLRERDE
jgi:hypothetical protein